MEPQYENHAIEQMRIYYTEKGHDVEDYIPLKNALYDKIYCSSIFTFTQKDHLLIDERWECGGTGFNIIKHLPPEIESRRIYKDFGWTQRGCNNNCSFCVVPLKEGCAQVVGDIYDIWSRKNRKITLYDNNILQLPDHFVRMCEQIRKENLKVDWNQGLDIRLLDNDIADMLGSLAHAEYHFAFDHSGLDKVVESKVEILKNHGINRNTFYVLVGCKDRPGKTAKEDIEDALYRLNLLKSLGQNAYVMRYRKVTENQPETLITKWTEKLYIPIANWGSIHLAFHGMDFFKDYLVHERGKSYKKYFDEIGIVG